MQSKEQQFCIQFSEHLKINFELRGRPLTYEEVFLHNGLLPAFAKRADQMCSLCLGYGIGISFKDDAKGTLSKWVDFDQVTPLPLRLLFMADTIHEFVASATTNGKTSLDELLYD